jgi:gliding motility-associated-like protein
LLIIAAKNQYMKKNLILTISVLLVSTGLFSQISTTGTDFWLSYMQNFDDPENTQLYITSDVGANGTASIPGSGWTQNFTIPANGSVFVDVPASENAAIDVGNTILNKAVHVVASTSVAVYAANQRDASSDATLVMQTDALGDSYLVNTYSPFSSLPSQFVVVGVLNGTSIEIIPSAAVMGGVGANVPFTITLNQGQVYLVQSMGDLTGTSVKATTVGNCNNFAVFAGNQCANVPLSCTYCDHLYEQMIPIKAWGQEYITVPLMTRVGDTYRILASVNGTVVNINGGAGINLNAGQFYETALTPASVIIGNNPISVAQYSEGTSCDGVVSDPFMIMLSPVEQTLEYIVFQAFNTPAINQFYTNIVTETAFTGLVQLDGAAVTGWATVPSNATYSYARKTLAMGSHVLTSTEGVLATVYGFGDVESYGYLAGANITPLNVSFDIVIDGNPTAFDEFNDTLTCSQTTVDFQTNSTNISNIVWDFGDGSPTFAGNPALDHTFPNTGEYTVTMTFMRDGSCVEEFLELIVPVTNSLPPITELPDSIVCNGDPYTVFLNIPDVTYEWQDGSTNFSFTFSVTGDYSVTITDLVGCSVSEDCHIDFVDLSVTTTSTEITCNGTTDGTITANPNGGTGPYLYSWSTTPVETTQTIVGLAQGNYSVTVTEDQACTVQTTATITVPPSLVIDITGVQNVTCFGFDNGEAEISASGGTNPYTIAWDQPTISGFEPTDLAPGTYSFTVTDDNGCFGSDSFIITDPPLFEVTSTQQNVDCHGNNTGQITLTLTGGTTPYEYNWSNGLMVQDLYNIPAGAYVVTVTDFNNCTITNTFVITEPDELETIVNSENVACYGQNTGQVILNITGGTFPFNFEWNNETNTQSQVDVFFGTYIVTVTDAHGCSAYAYAQITQPTLPLHGEITQTDVRCFGEANGIADLNVTGGTMPYYYVWSNGEISEDISELGPGTYMVTITDENGCISADTILLVQAVAPMNGSISGTNVTCNGGDNGNVYLNMTGGRPPYQFEWNTGSWQQNLIGVTAGLYSVTATDQSGCHFELEYEITQPLPFYVQPMDNPTICYGMTTEIGIGIISGSVPPYTILWSNDDNGMTTFVNPTETTVYSAHIVDLANCVSEDVEITVFVTEPLSLDVTASAYSVCPGSNVTFDITFAGGGITGNTIYVNDSLMTMPIELDVLTDTVFNFALWDNCHFDSIMVAVPISAYPLPPIDIIADRYSGCAPLTVQFNELSADIGQRYIWNFDDGDFENLSFDKNPVHVFYNSRTYHVYLEVTSIEGCKNDTTIGITAFPVPDAEFRANTTSISTSYPLVIFSNYTDGGFWYNWDFGDGSFSNDENPNHSFNLAGIYRVILHTTSLYGCFDTASVDITVNGELTVYAPTAFTPNYDELNEEFRIYAANVDLETYKLMVFSRWGEKVFESEEYEQGWDGRYNDMECVPGVYSWIATFKDLYGNTYEKAGYFTLIR